MTLGNLDSLTDGSKAGRCRTRVWRNVSSNVIGNVGRAAVEAAEGPRDVPLPFPAHFVRTLARQRDQIMTVEAFGLLRRTRADWLRAQAQVAYVRVLMMAQRYGEALRREQRFNPYHDELGRFTTADGAASSRGQADDGLVQQVQGRLPARRVTVGGRVLPATEAEVTQFETSARRVENARRRFNELAPGEQIVPVLTDPNSIQGAIDANRFIAQQYEARITFIERGGVPLSFNSMDEFRSFGWEVRSSLARSGNADAEVYLRGSAVTGYSYRTGEPFDVGRVSDLDLALVSPRLLGRAVELGIELRGRERWTRPLDELDMQRLGILEAMREIRQQTGRGKSNFMIYRDRESLTARGPNILIP